MCLRICGSSQKNLSANRKKYGPQITTFVEDPQIYKVNLTSANFWICDSRNLSADRPRLPFTVRRPFPSPFLSLCRYGDSECLAAKVKEAAEGHQEGGQNQPTHQQSYRASHVRPPRLGPGELLFLLQGADSVDGLAPVRSCSECAN
jgi:hypothetical protein